ncbi:hypothetical protein CRUP_011889 [Coryphaenoides rupestris]|nr:hypothetical protein CRUP_011889 [Coryphaenoides rupestris]
MGALISRWRTKPTTVEQLENLDKEIKDLEEFRTKNQRLLKLWIGRLLLYSSVLYLLTCVIVYWLYLPEQWTQRIAMALPFFMFPVLVWFTRKLLVYLFSKRTERNNDKLEDLKVSKRKILEEVMETETYKNAKLILERFDPEAKNKAELEATPVRPQMTPRPGQELRQRGVAMRPMPMASLAGMMSPPTGPSMAPGATPLAPGGPPERSAMSTPVHQGPIHRTPCSPIPGVGMHPPGPPLARPILPRERGAVDRVVEYLVGDGPQNRYALICQQCFSHNGMALKEEFEYLAFRCAYCYFMNPARKTRPQAPRLPEFNFERRLRAESPSPGPTHQHPDRPVAQPLQNPDEAGKEEESAKQLVDNSQSEQSLHQEEVEVEEEKEKEEEQLVEEPMEEAESGEAPSNPSVQETELQPSDLQ